MFPQKGRSNQIRLKDLLCCHQLHPRLKDEQKITSPAVEPEVACGPPDRSAGGSRGERGAPVGVQALPLPDDDANEDEGEEETAQLFRHAASGSCVGDLSLQKIKNL